VSDIDIVERLRDRSYHWCAGIDPMPGDCQECDERAEAADEIERLRTLNDSTLTFRELEAKVRDGSLNMRAVMGDEPSVQWVTKTLAFMMLHMLLGEDGEMPPNYRTASLSLSPGGTGETYKLALEVVRPGGKSSHDIRRDLEAQLDALRLAVTP